jgi:G patch domain-containing protein 1
MGQTLLQKLGWRPGQGIGPRVTLRKLKIQEGKLGKARLGIEEDEDVEEAGKHTYAPRDARLLAFDTKDDKEGLGYQKGAGMGKLPARRASECIFRPKLIFPVYGAGMGEDEEDDPYGSGPSAGLDSRHYAFDHGEEDNDVIVMGDQPSSKDTRDSRGGNRASASGDHWHDGRPVVVGFILDIKGAPKDKW